jgi:hypothetical protein
VGVGSRRRGVRTNVWDVIGELLRCAAAVRWTREDGRRTNLNPWGTMNRLDRRTAHCEVWIRLLATPVVGVSRTCIPERPCRVKSGVDAR